MYWLFRSLFPSFPQVVEAVNGTTNNCHYNDTVIPMPTVDSRLYMLAFLPILMLLVLVGNLRVLSIFSMLANVSMLVSLIIISHYIARVSARRTPHSCRGHIAHLLPRLFSSSTCSWLKKRRLSYLIPLGSLKYHCNCSHNFRDA